MTKSVEELIHGYQKFRIKYFGGNNRAYANLVKYGQRPKVLVIACSDSRVDPAILLNCNPGDLFVVRNVANLVPPFESDNSYHGTSAAVEFGVCSLGIEDVIVFGHSQCGGITSLFEREQQVSQPGFTSKWMELAKPAYHRVKTEHPSADLENAVAICCQYTLVNSLANLRTFPWIQDRLESGVLSLHAWYFDLKSGLIHYHDEETGLFPALPSTSPVA